MAEAKLLADRPTLIFKVDAFRSPAPKGVMQDLVREFADAGDAVRLITKAGLLEQIQARREAAGRTSRVGTRAVVDLFYQQARQFLRAGYDVVTDASFNTVQSRKEIPLTVARRSGAFAVALNFGVPSDVVAALCGGVQLNGDGPGVGMPNREGLEPAGPEENGLRFVFDVNEGAGAALIAHQLGGLFEKLSIFAPDEAPRAVSS